MALASAFKQHCFFALQQVDIFTRVCKMSPMKKSKTSKQIRLERPPRATVSKEEALKRMKQFAQRKERFLATARANKS